MEKQNIISTNSMNQHTKNQLLRELLDGISLDDLRMLVDLKKEMHSISTPTPKKPVPLPRTKTVKQMAQNYEDNIIKPPLEFRDYYKPKPKKQVPLPRTKTVKQMAQEYEDNIIQPPLEFRDDYKPIPTPRTKLSNEFNFDDTIFDSTSNDQPLFKITEIRNTANKKFNAYTNEFKINVRKNFINNKNDVFSVFEKMVEMTIKKRQLKSNDRIRLVISNDELNHPISTKLLKVSDFKLNQLSDVINTLEYKEIYLENCKIIIQSVKIPSGKGRLYLSKQTVNRKRCIITIKNNDTICLARAIVTAYANLHPENYTTTQLKDGFNKSRKLQEIQAKELHNNANVEINEYGNSLEDVNSFASHLDVEINIIDSEQFNEIIYTSNNGKTDKIYLYKTRNHFDVIKSMTAFLDVAYYCHSCKKAYTRRDKHKCPQKCLSCFKYFPDGNKCDGKAVYCKHCNRVFHGNSCFKNHTSNRSKDGDDSVCSSVAKCLKCNQIILKPYIKIHKCGHKMCNNCNRYCESKHECFIKKIKCKGGNCIKDNKNPCRLNKNIPRKDYCYSCRTYNEKYLFFDFECTQNTGTHEVNLAICHDFNGNESIFNDINSFCNGLLIEKYKGYTFLAHNAKGYDSYFILKWCIDNGFKPYCIYNGAKIMMMEIPQLRIKIIDSLNFIQQPLASFPKTFGLNELKKGYFPHYFNKICNQNYIGEMPSKKHYGYNQMKTQDRQKFLQWYDDCVNENYVFDFKKELIEYCRSDVDILRRCMLKFRQNFMNQENIDPLKYITIAGVCMAIYRGNYMSKNTIAVVDNVVQTENHSVVSIAWLDYISKKNNIKIQHALEGGEKVIKCINNKLKVDGFCESTNTVYEFHGCFWHGCPDCYKPDVINNKNQSDMGTLYNKTQDKNNKITAVGYNLIEMWECKLKKDKSFQKYYKNDWNREVVEPLNPRDAFYGGRTNATKLLYKFKEGECGKYVDFCSLYPTVQFYKKYPIGHPKKIISPEKYDTKWYGFIKCKILSPRELYHPVLPQKIKCEKSEKLMFPLCISCAETKQKEKCQHSENERSFIGTWTSDEVNKALEKGYKIIKIYEVWHFEKSTDDLFKGYIKKFMKLKLESTKYNFKNDKEEMMFRNKVKKNLDIELGKLYENAGLRAIAKMCLNSLWGKFGQRNNMNQCKYVTDINEFYQVVLDDTIDNLNMNFINEEMVQMSYTYKDHFVDNSYNTNIFVACFTTSSARLMLYEKLEYLDKQVLYYDTDSILYIQSQNSKVIETGDMLGELTDELDGETINNTFVSGGPKNYSFIYGDNKQKCVIKGFRLNHENSQILNHTNMIKMVKKEIKDLTLVNENKITRQNKQIINKYEEKVYSFGYDKRAIKYISESCLETYPYGY